MLRMKLLVLSLLLSLCACPSTEPTPPRMDSRIVVDGKGHVPPLVCPGALGCESATGGLRVGVAKRSVTPEVETWEDLDGDDKYDVGETFDDRNHNGVWDPVWIAGFGVGRAATGVHDDNWARVLLFEQGDLRYGVVALDLIGVFHSDVIRIRQTVALRGLELDHVLVASTHQHEGKDTMGNWGRVFAESGYDDAYMQYIADQAADALEEAVLSAQPARLRVAVGQAAGFVRDSREPTVIDQRLTSIAFVDNNDDVFALLVNWGNHPEALDDDNTLLTSDYPHYLRQHLEQTYPQATAVFLNGCLGGLTTTIGIVGCPDAQGNQTCPQGTFARAEYIGVGAAKAAVDALQGDSLIEDNAPLLSFRRKPFFVGTSNMAFFAMFQWGVFKRQVFDAEHELMSAADVRDLLVDEALAGAMLLQSEVNTLHLGPVELVTVPGELYAEIWMPGNSSQSLVEHPEGADYADANQDGPIENLLDANTIHMLVNLGNDELGYIVPKAQWDVAEPRAYDEDGQYGEENSLGHDAAPTIVKAIEEMFAL